MTPRLRPYQVSFLVAVVAVFAYVPSLSCGFVWDDLGLVGQPDRLEKYSLLDVFRDNSWHLVEPTRFFRPILFWSYRLDVWAWGRGPAGYHLTNILLFGASVWCVAMLSFRLGLGILGTLTTSFFFALHPVHVEAVAWVSGRSDLLSTLFALVSVLLLLSWRRSGSYFDGLPGSVFLALSLLTKEVSVVVPVALLATVVGRGRGHDNQPEQEGALSTLSAREVLRYAVPALILVWILRHNCPGVVIGYPYGSPGSAAELALVTLINLRLAGRYLAAVLLGVDFGPLAFSELVTIRRMADNGAVGLLVRELDFELFLAATAVFFVLPWCLARSRKDLTIRMGLILFAGGLILSMNLTSASHQIAFGDRYLYLPSLGIALVLGSLAAEASASRREASASRSRPPWPAVLMVCACLFWASQKIIDRTGRYRDQITFWSSATKLNPLSAHAHHGLGVTLLQAGDLDGAAASLQNAWRLTHLAATREALAQVREARIVQSRSKREGSLKFRPVPATGSVSPVGGSGPPSR